MTTKTMDQRKEEILDNLINEYNVGVQFEERFKESLTEIIAEIKESIKLVNNCKQNIIEQQLKNNRNKLYLKSILPKFPNKCKY
jgi:hypothetical protein